MMLRPYFCLIFFTKAYIVSQQEAYVFGAHLNCLDVLGLTGPSKPCIP